LILGGLLSFGLIHAQQPLFLNCAAWTGHDRAHEYTLEGQQQILRATFPGIRNGVRVLLKVRMDRLALKFHETKDLKVRDEIYRLCRELMKLDEPWVFVAS
jgi:hypothetical protein